MTGTITITMTDDKAIPMLTIRHSAGGTFCVIDTLEGIRIVLDGSRRRLKRGDTLSTSIWNAARSNRAVRSIESK